MSEPEGYQALAAAEIEAMSQSPERRSLGQKLRWPLMIGVPVVILALVAYFVLTGGKSEATDNAYVVASRAAISSSIPGRVIEVDVTENQAVKKGQVLFRLDAADYDVAIAQAEAALAAARQEAESAQGVYGQRQADLAAAQETVAYSQREAARQRSLAQAGVATQAQADEAAHAAALAARQVAVVRQEIASALADIGGRPGVGVEQQAKVRQAQAELDRARLNRGYATVVAPADGVVAKVAQLQVGNRVAASQTVFWLISGKPWVEANFKEDQLARMRIGQPASIRIDAYDHALRGHVASFSPGTGSSFALLPAENATGNWVKVVQRLPVRIDLDETAPQLSAGLSAEVKVDIRPGARAEPAPR